MGKGPHPQNDNTSVDLTSHSLTSHSLTHKHIKFRISELSAQAPAP